MQMIQKIYMHFLGGVGFSIMLIDAAFALPLYLLKMPAAEFFFNHFGKAFMWLYGVELEIIGTENIPEDGKGIILAPNHESTFDIFILSSLPYKLRWISKIEVAYLPFIGWAMKAMGCYFVRRDKSGHDLAVMKKVEDDLKNGTRIVMFPEGTRTRTGELLPFKKGAFRTAQNAGICLLPVAITGTRTVAPARGVPTHRGHKVKIRFGKPFSVQPGDLAPSIVEYRKTLSNLLQEDRGKGYDS